MLSGTGRGKNVKLELGRHWEFVELVQSDHCNCAYLNYKIFISLWCSYVKAINYIVELSTEYVHNEPTSYPVTTHKAPINICS